MHLTNSIGQNVSTSVQSQTQEHQLLSNILHSPRSNPNVRPFCSQVLSSVPQAMEPKKTQLMSQNPVITTYSVTNLAGQKEENAHWEYRYLTKAWKAMEMPL